MNARLPAALERGPLILDAGMGTRLIALGLDLGVDDPAAWNLARPEAVAELHARDVAAGADGVLTNTFGATRPWLGRFGLAGEFAHVNRRAVELARGAAGPDRFVLGSIGPTAAGAAGSYREQAEVLADEGVDAVLLETHRAEQAEVGLRELAGKLDVPIFVSLSFWPDPIEDAASRLADLGAAALGANCLDGMAAALRLAESLHVRTALPLLMKPSAGRPGGEVETPGAFASAVSRLLELGVRLLGGCCGTTDAHVAALRAACYHHPSKNVRFPSRRSFP